jgi:TusA-related sulfurtransferase
MLELNLSGLNCPLPILKAKKFLADMASGTQIKIITTDPASVVDFQDFCNKTGHKLLNQVTNNDVITTIIERR